MCQDQNSTANIKVIKHQLPRTGKYKFIGLFVKNINIHHIAMNTMKDIFEHKYYEAKNSDL